MSALACLVLSETALCEDLGIPHVQVAAHTQYWFGMCLGTEASCTMRLTAKTIPPFFPEQRAIPHAAA